jgi:hypothetical protein
MATSSSRVTALVKKAISGTEGTPDWSTILEILGILESSPAAIPKYIGAIISFISTGSRAARTNALILTDALFKNSKREQLSALQSQLLLRALSDPIVSSHPDLHNFLFKNTPLWVSNCTAQHCLDATLAAFQQSVCRGRFVPSLPDTTLIKLFRDLETSAEVITLLAQIVATQGDTPLIAEILPNVREIGRRLIDLEPVIEEPGLRAAIATQRQFCLLVQQMVSDVRAKNPIDTAKVAAAATAVQQAMDARRPANGALIEKTRKRPRRRRRPGEDEMATDEFFRRFDQVKGSTAEPALLDLMAPVAAADSLIDSLIDL